MLLLLLCICYDQETREIMCVLEGCDTGKSEGNEKLFGGERIDRRHHPNPILSKGFGMGLCRGSNEHNEQQKGSWYRPTLEMQS
jgi:hypothetical protein